MRILFVCSGNTCRSPLAEAIAARMLEEKGRVDIEVSSAGTQAWDGSPASDGALLVGMERGLELSAHRARRVSPAILAQADVVMVMAPSHLSHVREMSPGTEVHLLGGYGAGEDRGYTMQDPFGGDLAAYRETADDLQREIASLFDRILKD